MLSLFSNRTMLKNNSFTFIMSNLLSKMDEKMTPMFEKYPFQFHLKCIGETTQTDVRHSVQYYKKLKALAFILQVIFNMQIFCKLSHEHIKSNNFIDCTNCIS